MPVYDVTVTGTLEWDYTIRAGTRVEAMKIARELSIGEPPNRKDWYSSNIRETDKKEADNDEISS